jgi:hypothetical protein
MEEYIKQNASQNSGYIVDSSTFDTTFNINQCGILLQKNNDSETTSGGFQFIEVKINYKPEWHKSLFRTVSINNCF